jgi:hypothetical protein
MPEKSLNRKNYCKFAFVSQFGEILLPKKLSGHSGFPMDSALVNAGSHNPPSNVFYVVHKALGGWHYQNQGAA